METTMSFRDDFSKEEWFTLQCAPVWVFAIVAGIDGKIDKKEMKSFTKTLVAKSRNSFGFSGEIYKSIISNIDAVMHVKSNGETALAGLIAINALLKKINETDATLYKRSLVELGNEVAESSGSIFKKRSDKETKVLGLIMQIFELI
jgi:hypothetical protein